VDGPIQKDDKAALMQYYGVLRYGKEKGSPLTQRGLDLLSQQRECSRTALLAFSRVRSAFLRRSSRARSAACEVVQLPLDVIATIMIAAGLEIGETFSFTVHV
jgi:hypothetical protein